MGRKIGRPFTSETAPRTGRKPGAKGKYHMLRKNVDLIAATKGITPLEVLHGVAADETCPVELRVKAAGDAAPYLHAKRPTTLVNPDGSNIIPATINVTFTKPPPE